MRLFPQAYGYLNRNRRMIARSLDGKVSWAAAVSNRRSTKAGSDSRRFDRSIALCWEIPEVIVSKTERAA